MPASSAASVDRGGLQDDVLWTDVQRGVGRRELDRELGERPVAVVAAGRAEDLPEGWEVGRVDDLELVLGHLLESLGQLADLRALPLGERDDPSVIVGVDDLRAAVAHPRACVQHLRLDDLDARDVARGIEDLARVDHRVRDGDEVGADVAFRRA